jgi:hypothetical protein
MDSIKYSDNWNGKLLCDCWADVRKPFPGKYTPGTILEIQHDRIGFLGYAKVMSVQPFHYKNITDNMSFTVTGQPAGFLKKMLCQFYEDITPESPLVHVIIKFTERNADTLHQLLEKQYNKLLSITPRAKAAEYADAPHQ